MRKIPRGRVVTYAALARRFCTSPRAIGSIMRANVALDAYHCYKVVASSGALTGYSGRGGIAQKRRLLRADGVRFAPDGRVLPECFWDPR
ncbi:MAG: MGMT family protein [bacterium]|nr:MGMT family protein [bacterium]